MSNVFCSCPSRNRPELLNQMMDSFMDTSTNDCHLMVYVDEDDGDLESYKKLVGKYERCNFKIGQRMQVAQAHNYLINIWHGYDFYMPLNDDVIFVTKNWDIILSDTIKEKGDWCGIAYGNDSTGNYKHQLPTFGMMSGNIVRILGYFYPLKLRAMFGDTFLLDFGRAIGRLYYRPDVILKHMPPPHCLDDHRNEPSFYKREQLAYASYINNHLDDDVRKIFGMMTNKKTVLV